MNCRLLLVMLCLSCTRLHAQLEFYNCPVDSSYRYVRNAMLLTKSMMGKDTAFLKWEVDPGHSTVLKYDHFYDCIGTRHFAIKASLLLSIPPDYTSFTIDLNNMDTSNVRWVYATVCQAIHCDRYTYEMIKGEGTISGRLVKNTWQVKGKIKMILYDQVRNFQTSKDITVNGTFKPWKKLARNRRIPDPFFDF